MGAATIPSFVGMSRCDFTCSFLGVGKSMFCVDAGGGREEKEVRVNISVIKFFLKKI